MKKTSGNHNPEKESTKGQPKPDLMEAFIASEVRYRRLFETAKDGILILDAETGMIVDVNPFLINLLGYSKEQFIKKEIWEIGFFKDIIDNKDKFWELQQAEYVRYEDLPLETADGRKINVEFVSNVYLVNNHKVIQCNIRDITERKVLEESLREKNRMTGEYLDVLLNNSRTPIIIWDSSLVIKRFNHEFEKLSGYNSTEVIDEKIDVLFPEDKIDSTLKLLNSHLNDENLEVIEIDLLTKNKDIKTVLWNSANIFDKDGTRTVATITHDISNRKRSEETLRISEEKYRRIFENVQDVYYEVAIDGTILEVSPSIEIHSKGKYDRENLIGKSMYDFYSIPGGRQAFLTLLQQQGSVTDYEVILKNLDGSNVPCSISAKIQFDANHTPLKIIGSIRDITDHKRAEEAMRETNDKLIRAQLVAHIGSWETELLNLKVVWSEETYRIFEVEPNSFISHSGFWEFVHPEDRMKVDAAFEGSIGKHSFNSIEHRIITPSGIVKFVEECWEVIYDNQGLPLRVVGTCQDITERKRAEKALIKSRELLKNVEKTAKIGGWEFDVETMTQTWTEETFRILEVDIANGIPKVPEGIDFIASEFQPMALLAIQRAIEHGEPYDQDWKIITTKGNKRWVHAIAIPYQENGKTKTVAGSFQDITDLKRAEEDENMQKEILQRVFDNIPVMITYFNKTGNIEMVNREFIEKLGWTFEEWKTDNIFAKCYPDSETFKEVLDFMTNKPIGWKDFMITTKYGTVINTTWTNISLSDGVSIGIGQDITERKRAEQELRESEQRLNFHVNNSPLATIEWNTDFVVTRWSGEAEKIFGWNESETIGKPIMDLQMIYDEDIPIVQKTMERLSDGSSKHVVSANRNYTKSKKVIYCEWYNSVLLSPQDKMISVMSQVMDITMRKQAEDAILQAKKNWEDTFDSITDAMTIHDKDYNIIFSNKAGKALLKLPELEKHLKLKCYSFYHGTDIPPAGCLSCSSLKNGLPGVFELFEPNLGRYIEIRAIPTFDSDNQTTGLIHIVRDVSERKLAEEELIKSKEKVEESEKKLIEAQKTAHIGHWDWNLKKQRLNWSDEIFNIFGVSKESFPVTVENFEKTIHPDDLNDFLLKRNGTLQKGSIINIDHRIVRPNGEIRYVQELSQVLRDKDNEPISVFGTVQDITDLKFIELELIKSKEKAEESDRLKSSFLAAMSHELRTPLNAVIGFSGFLGRNLSGDDVVEFGKIINTSGNQLLSIINDIFDITLIESGQTKILKEKTSLNTILYDIHNIIGAEQQRANKNEIELRLMPPSEEEDIMIYTDAAKLKQILINLLKNALKFTKKGHIHYGYNVEDIDGKHVFKFFVEDTGIGIPENKKQIIFDMFRQVEETLSRKFGGTGIGLSISKKLTELLGGKIWVESKEKVGSTFYFTIPFETPEEVSKPVKKETAGKNNLKGKTILVVEDDEPSYKLLKIILENSGVYTLWAKNGKEAIKCCHENTGIDLVLMDMNMPVMNGYDATMEIKKFRPGLPIIAQTAHAVVGDREKALAADCNDYISKPINKNKLMGLIEKHLSRPITG